MQTVPPRPKTKTLPKPPNQFIIVRILKRAMVQALDEDTMPRPVAQWGAPPSKPLMPLAPGNQANQAAYQGPPPPYTYVQLDETQHIAELRAWLLANPEIISRIDTAIRVDYSEETRQFRSRASFLTILFTIGGIVFGILIGLALAFVLGAGRRISRLSPRPFLGGEPAPSAAPSAHRVRSIPSTFTRVPAALQVAVGDGPDAVHAAAPLPHLSRALLVAPSQRQQIDALWRMTPSTCSSFNHKREF